jgi:hypothetical protein
MHGTRSGQAGDRSVASSGPREVLAIRTVHWILRVAVAACFIGHGAFGLITKAAWLPYFAVWGIPEAVAWRLMPIVGIVDIGAGVLTLLAPIPALLFSMTFWGFQTAGLRLLTGQGVWEVLERAGNYGVPLAFLLALGLPARLRAWRIPHPGLPMSAGSRAAVGWVLRTTTALLLLGHGGFGFAMEKDVTSYVAAVGISPAVLSIRALTIAGGVFEAALGLAVLAWPSAPLLIAVGLWKVATEFTRVLAGEPIWEFIERAGSYGAPLTLAWLQSAREEYGSVAHART